MNNKPVHGDYVQGSPSNHPGVPVGDDKVPAWLAPNEFVVNQEATAMYGPQIEAMNNHGRAVQAQHFGNYANSIAQLESGGREDPYSIMGGSNDHYVGKYQLGADAISDASKFLGMENTPSREDVRKNPQLQERLFNAYTQVNHRTLERLSDQ